MGDIIKTTETPDYIEFTKYFGNGRRELYEKIKPLKDSNNLAWGDLAKVQWWQIDMENKTLGFPVAKVVTFELTGTTVKRILERFRDNFAENRVYALPEGEYTIYFKPTDYEERCGIFAVEGNKIIFLVSERKLQSYLMTIDMARRGGNPTICSYASDGIILNLVTKMKRS